MPIITDITNQATGGLVQPSLFYPQREIPMYLKSSLKKWGESISLLVGGIFTMHLPLTYLTYEPTKKNLEMNTR